MKNTKLKIVSSVILTSFLAVTGVFALDITGFGTAIPQTIVQDNMITASWYNSVDFFAKKLTGLQTSTAGKICQYDGTTVNCNLDPATLGGGSTTSTICTDTNIISIYQQYFSRDPEYGGANYRKNTCISQGMDLNTLTTKIKEAGVVNASINPSTYTQTDDYKCWLNEPLRDIDTYVSYLRNHGGKATGYCSISSVCTDSSVNSIFQKYFSRDAELAGLNRRKNYCISQTMNLNTLDIAIRDAGVNNRSLNRSTYTQTADYQCWFNEPLRDIDHYVSYLRNHAQKATGYCSYIASLSSTSSGCTNTIQIPVVTQTNGAWWNNYLGTTGTHNETCVGPTLNSPMEDYICPIIPSNYSCVDFKDTDNSDLNVQTRTVTCNYTMKTVCLQ